MPRWRVTWRTWTRRSLPLTMGLVAAVFVAATAYSQFLLVTDADALDIGSNSAPSIAALADARGQLRALEGAVRRGERLAGGEHRRRIAAALAEYERTPDYPGEQELYRVVAEKLRRLDGVVARASGGEAALGDVGAALDEFDAALDALSDLNQRHLMASTQAIAQRARGRNLYAFLLDGVGILIAFVATVLAARTVDRYLGTLDRRTRELEHLAIQVGHDIANPLMPIKVALEPTVAPVDEAQRVAFERARRSLARIRETIDRLVAFAKAGMPPETPPLRSPLGPALADAGRAVGVAVEAEPELCVGVGEPALRELLRDFVAGGTRIAIAPSSRHVRVSVVRAAASADGGDPFDPQLHLPESDHPGIDLRLATVRRFVEAVGGAVGVRRSRSGEELWIELPRA